MPTVYWKQYVRDQLNGSFTSDDDNNVIPPDLVLEYLKKWTKMVTNIPLNMIRLRYGRFTLADIIIGINKYLLGNELDEAKKKSLYEIFNTLVLHRR